MVDFNSRCRLWPAIFVLLLAACEIGVVASLAAQPAHGRQALSASFVYDPGNRPDCPMGDAMILRVNDGRRAVLSRNSCSAYALGRARAMADSRGRNYILVEHAEGHGTHATSYFLSIYALAGGLHDRGCLLINQPSGAQTNSVFVYRVVTPLRGGLRLIGRWTVDGPRRRDDPAPRTGGATFDVDTAVRSGRALQPACPTP